MKANFEPQGPPLRAIVPEGLGLRSREAVRADGKLALHGGFSLVISGGTPKRPRAVSGPETPGDSEGVWARFGESFATTVLDLGKRKCAPPFIVWMPRGLHPIRPQGGKGLMFWRVTPGIAAVAARHAKAMWAKAAAGSGETPHIDFDHEGGHAADVLDFFWDVQRGVMAHVRWTKAGHEAVLSGRYHNFSPLWISQGEDFLGLRANCGGILLKEAQPAFRKMPWILPCSERRALELCADRFLRLVDSKSAELRASGSALPAVAALDAVRADHPELAEAYELRQAIHQEHLEDARLL